MIEITDGLNERCRQQAGLIYYEAFRRKFQPLVGEPAKTLQVLTAGLNLGMTIGALSDETLLGLAGLHHQGGIFSQVSVRHALQHLGLVRGLYARLVLNLFARGSCPAGELRIAALAVDAAARGQGLGSRLLEAVFAKAEKEGFRAVRLEVVDTNFRARQLYERSGFVVVKTHVYPIKREWLSFSGEHVMVKTL